jgi:hypothetical protein
VGIDRRWKNPPGADKPQLNRWAQDVVSELRKGPPDDWIDTAQLVDGCVTTPKLADGAVTTAKLGNDIVTYAKLQNISATARLLGRKSASAGDAEECTLSEALDFVGSATRGDLLMRGSSVWGRLAPGTSGLFLKSNGAGADLSWDAPASGLALLTSGSVASASSLDIVLTSYTGYRGLIFMLANFLPVTDGVTLMLRVSTNGGSSYDAAAGNYQYASYGINAFAGGVNNSTTSNTVMHLSTATAGAQIGNASGEGINGRIEIYRQTATGFRPRALFHTADNSNSFIADVVTQIGVGGRTASQDTDAVRFLFSSGNISSGDYAVYGLA